MLVLAHVLILLEVCEFDARRPHLNSTKIASPYAPPPPTVGVGLRPARVAHTSIPPFLSAPQCFAPTKKNAAQVSVAQALLPVLRRRRNPRFKPDRRRIKYPMPQESPVKSTTHNPRSTIFSASASLAPKKKRRPVASGGGFKSL